jgi:hypothetical protein
VQQLQQHGSDTLDRTQCCLTAHRSIDLLGIRVGAGSMVCLNIQTTDFATIRNDEAYRKPEQQSATTPGGRQIN